MRKLIKIINQKIIHSGLIKSNQTVESQINRDEADKKTLYIPHRRQKIKNNKISLKSFQNSSSSTPLLLAKSNLSGDQFYVIQSKLNKSKNTYKTSKTMQKTQKSQKQQNKFNLLMIPKNNQFSQVSHQNQSIKIHHQSNQQSQINKNSSQQFQKENQIIFDQKQQNIRQQLQKSDENLMNIQQINIKEQFEQLIKSINKSILYQLYKKQKSLLSDISLEKNIQLCLYLLVFFILCLIVQTIMQQSHIIDSFINDRSEKATIMINIQKIIYACMCLTILIYLVNLFITYKKQYEAFNYDFQVIRKVSYRLLQVNKIFNEYGYSLTCDRQMTWILLRQNNQNHSLLLDPQFQDKTKQN